jgi:hypothetical protein
VFFTGLGVQHVHGATQSRVKGAYEPPHVDGILDVRNRHADERFLDRATLAHVVHGIAVPECGGHDLVIVDLFVLHLQIVQQGAARSLGEAGALARVRDFGLNVGLGAGLALLEPAFNGYVAVR